MEEVVERLVINERLCPSCNQVKSLDCFEGGRVKCRKCRYIEQYGGNRIWRLKRDYNLDIEEYDVLLNQQGGVCAICLTPEVGRALAVDHDHRTGNVRGLLCFKCNRGLGQLGDSVEALERALLYLRKSEE